MKKRWVVVQLEVAESLEAAYSLQEAAMKERVHRPVRDLRGTAGLLECCLLPKHHHLPAWTLFAVPASYRTHRFGRFRSCVFQHLSCSLSRRPNKHTRFFFRQSIVRPWLLCIMQPLLPLWTLLRLLLRDGFQRTGCAVFHRSSRTRT